MHCYKHLMGIIAESVVLNTNEEKESEKTKAERNNLISELRKHADLPSEKIIYEEGEKKGINIEEHMRKRRKEEEREGSVIIEGEEEREEEEEIYFRNVSK